MTELSWLTPATMPKRSLFYCLIVLLGFAVFIPLPFAPRTAHDLFSSFIGAALPLLAFFILVIFAIAFTIWHGIKRTLDRYIILESLAVPILFLLVRILLHEPISEFRYSTTVWLNDGKTVDSFVNPYLGLKMFDCRNVSDSMDAIFIPEHLGVETFYLEYSPQKDFVYDSGGIVKFYGRDWYLVSSGSQWYGTDLGKCVGIGGAGR